MFIAVILENFSQAQEDVQQVTMRKTVLFISNLSLGLDR